MGDRWAETREELLLVAIGNQEVLAKGRLYEHSSLDGDLNITGPGSSVFVSADEILWLDRKGRVRRLAFEGIESFSEVRQYHRFALLLKHEPVEFLELVPANHFLWWRWGTKWMPRERTQTILAFSHDRAEVATAIEDELIQRQVSSGEPIQMHEQTRAERTAGSHAVLHRRSK
jgi:hypothetical protein